MPTFSLIPVSLSLSLPISLLVLLLLLPHPLLPLLPLLLLSTTLFQTMANNLVVSGPFNVQHIPKIKSLAPAYQSRNNDDQKLVGSASSNFGVASPGGSSFPSLQNNYSNSNAYSNSYSNSSTPKSAARFVPNTIVVCVHPFEAEYENEVSCAPGDIFKLVDSKCVNGWILTMSITSGSKGWIPKDNVKVLDLQNSTPIDCETPPLRSTSKACSASSPITKKSESPVLTKSASYTTQQSLDSSLLDYYSSSSLSPSSVLKSESVESTNNNCASLPYNSIFAHSMNLSEFSSSTFWYRIDLTSRLHPTQQIHIARYYTDIYELNKKLQSHVKHANLNISLPKLPRSFGLESSRNSVDLLSSNLSHVSNYLADLFAIVDALPSISSLVQIFEEFCMPADNDFQHYVDLSDDQILNILKPANNASNSFIELDFSPDFKKPSQNFNEDRTRSSISSTNSKHSAESAAIAKSEDVKVKLLFREDYIMIKLQTQDLTFAQLKAQICSKLKVDGFTLAYKNEQSIFVLLRDDRGLQRALDMNPRKMIIKVI